MSTKYLKKIEGVDGYTRVDNKPVFNEVSTISEYRIDGDWYDATGTKLPPQSYIENPDGTLVEFEVQDGKVVDKHSGDYVPSIVENAINVKSLTITDEFDLGQTWQDVTASRSAGVTYTNDTGKPITVSVIANIVTGQIVQLAVDGSVVTQFQVDAGGNKSVVTIVPNGSTYEYTGVNTKWSELR